MTENDAMQCSSCGTEMPESSLFCPKCGAPVRGSSDEPQPAPPPEPQSTPTAAERLRQSADQRRDQDDTVEEETDLWQGGYSGKAMIGSWILAGVVTIALLVAAIMINASWGWWGFLILTIAMWVYLGCLVSYRKLSVDYQLTSQRFIHKSGILKRRADRIEVIDIDDVTYEQGIVQRMVGVGTIRIISSDRSHPELVLPGIDDVRRIADLIDDVRRKERRRRGLHIEAI